MRIGIDLHGTLDKVPELFNLIINDYLEDGHEVYIISGSEKEKIKKELERFNINVTDIYSCIDFLKQKNISYWYDKNKEFWCSENIWWESKANLCFENKINILIDDKREYQKYFTINHPTKFILFDNNITESIKNLNNICNIKNYFKSYTI